MTTIDTPEQILCLRRDDLPVKWLGQRTVEKMTEMKFYAALANTPYYWVPRDKAEADTQYKQLIPYVILQTESSSLTACYQRHGTEKRLHDLWSVGIGGHINPVDKLEQNSSFEQILIAGMERELNEELNQRPENDCPIFIGVISEDLTDVGKVHLGAVFRILTDNPEKFSPGSELFSFAWKKTKDLDQLNLELWSKLALKLISEH